VNKALVYKNDLVYIAARLDLGSGPISNEYARTSFPDKRN